MESLYITKSQFGYKVIDPNPTITLYLILQDAIEWATSKNLINGIECEIKIEKEVDFSKAKITNSINERCTTIQNELGLTDDELVTLLLENYDSRKQNPPSFELDDEIVNEYFCNIKEENKAAVLTTLEISGNAKTTAINLTQQELVRQAALLSNRSMQRVITQGIESFAQKLITENSKPDDERGQGNTGSADGRIVLSLKKLIVMLENKQLKYLNTSRLTGTSMTGLPTIKSFLEKNNLSEFFRINPKIDASMVDQMYTLMPSLKD